MTWSVRRPASLLAAAAAGALLTIYTERLTAPSAAARHGADVLAVVDGETITADDFTRELRRRGGLDSFPRAESRRALLDDMVQEAKVIAAAKRAGYDRDPDVLRQVQYLLVGTFNQDVENQIGTVEVSHAEVRAFYDAHPERFSIPEAAHAALIFIAVPPNAPAEFRQEKLAFAERLRAEAAQADDPAQFGDLAKAYSDDNGTRYRGGDIRWVERRQTHTRWDASVLDAIFAVEAPGALSPVIAAQNGLYVIRLLERRPASLRPLDEVAGDIHDSLIAEKRQRRRDELYAAATAPLQVEVREQGLAALQLPNVEVVDGRGAPPPLPE